MRDWDILVDSIKGWTDRRLAPLLLYANSRDCALVLGSVRGRLLSKLLCDDRGFRRAYYEVVPFIGWRVEVWPGMGKVRRRAWRYLLKRLAEETEVDWDVH